MLILAIDTSGSAVSTALLENDQLLLELNSVDAHSENSIKTAKGVAGSQDQLPPGYTRKRSKRGSKTSRIFPPGASELLVPMVKSLMERASVSFEQLNLIALTTGPGLFTGLRVGVVTAKAFAYSTKADLIGVSSLEVIAAQTAASQDCSNKVICPVLNAQRQQLFCGQFDSVGDWRLAQKRVATAPDSQTPASQILMREAWMESLNGLDVVVTGTGLKPFVDSIDQPNVTIANPENWACKASSVGKYAWQQYESGRRDDFWKLEPDYFRPSAAEENRDRKAKAAQSGGS